MTPAAKAKQVKTLARELGFDRIGITHAGPLRRHDYYRNWLAAGHHGTMRYLERNLEAREEPAQLLPGAKSVICVALNYRRPESADSAGSLENESLNPPLLSGERAGGRGEGAQKHQESSPQPSPYEGEGVGPTGRIAQYARGRDYHQVLWEMLHELTERLRAELNEPFETRICVDTAPLLERELARAAGLGWIGKNTCLMHQSTGSYLFLGEILTTLELVADLLVPDHCGTCTRCLDACPTQAFPAPYQMDASRCISYFTIEQRGEIPPEFHAAIGDWVYGCDICQEVCPFNANSRAPSGTHPQIMENRLPARIELNVLTNLTSGDYRRLTKDSAARRATRGMWRRNAAIALDNLKSSNT